MAHDAAERLAQEPDVGRVSDGVIARRLGISRKTVLAWRKRQGIRAYDDPVPAGPLAAPQPPRPGPPPISHRVDQPAGDPRRAKASRLEAFAHLLGTMPDRELAVRAGVSPENVRMYRQRRGIVAQWREGEGPPTRVELALAQVGAELGRVPDAVIASRVGVSRSAVTQYRARHGIAAGRKEAHVVESAPVVRPDPIGFEVTVRSPAGAETLTVLSTDAASAALAAARFGEVLQLRRIGRVV